MAQSKATPGPWTAKWSKYVDGVFIVQTEHPSKRVLAKFDGDGDGADDQSIADAHLIAAAPDMLAALWSAESAVQELCHDQHHENQCWVVLAEIRSAISRAHLNTKKGLRG